MLLARGHLMRALSRHLRLAVVSACIIAGGSAAMADRSVCTNGDGQHIRKVCFDTFAGAAVYGHGVLGDTPEWNELTVFWGPKGRQRTDGLRGSSTFNQPRHIFEDVAPRITDLNGDGIPEIIVVQSSFDQGGRLMVLDTQAGLRPVTTPYIGRRNRWLAPIGAADLDGDGYVEIAYIDRPHLAKTLRVWRFKEGGLTEIATLQGLSNHRIGEADIGGGIRTCSGKPEMVVASGDWQSVMVVGFQGNQLIAKDVGKHTGRDSLNAALACK
ncbi:MAG: VCBS repeat-containing protein [Sulfitobacter sp.]